MVNTGEVYWCGMRESPNYNNYVSVVAVETHVDERGVEPYIVVRGYTSSFEEAISGSLFVSMFRKVDPQEFSK